MARDEFKNLGLEFTDEQKDGWGGETPAKEPAKEPTEKK